MPSGVYKHKPRSQEVKDNLRNKFKGRVFSDEWKEKIRLANKGRKHSKETKRKIGLKSKGRVRSKETLLKMSLSMMGKNAGCKSHFWKGGITTINERVRKSVEYKLWRQSVFERDDYTCIWCYKRGGTIHADHIKPFSLFPELRFSIDNGRTLCFECHKTTNTYGFKIKTVNLLDMLDLMKK